MRLLSWHSTNITDAMEAKAISYNMMKTDIYSCSWGVTDNGKNTDGLKVLRDYAMEKAILNVSLISVISPKFQELIHSCQPESEPLLSIIEL